VYFHYSLQSDAYSAMAMVMVRVTVMVNFALFLCHSYCVVFPISVAKVIVAPHDELNVNVHIAFMSQL